MSTGHQNVCKNEQPPPWEKKSSDLTRIDFPNDLHALTTNIPHFVRQRLLSSPTLHPPLVKNPKLPIQSGLVTRTKDNSYLLEQNKQILEALQTLSQDVRNLFEKTEEYKQHMEDIA